ncbi:Target SNARE coiled-coil domain [Macleaya cordata]|uniref:Target SNARE coiled-coil domain n=1 Tax=Macleaya cordata TaxID=56857 RepID=A0A200Q9I9_MACCD|nr:Target SNARE coiled-coil domain [Macleaya cordata]
MNDLFSSLFHSGSTDGRQKDNNNGAAAGDVQMATSIEVLDLDKFFKDVESIKIALNEIETLYNRLQDSHERSKTIHSSKSIKQLRSQMDSDVSLALNKAKSIKVGLESLDRANAENLKLPGCGPGSSSDRTRSSIVNGLRKKLKDTMESFNSLRERIGIDYKETVERRYFMVTGEKADEQTVENLISSGESETFMQKVIQEQGRGRVVDTIAEIQERHDAVMEIEKSLNELHQVFMDMAVLVQVQGEQLDDIESQVGRASSFVRRGNNKLQRARILQKNTRKWSMCAIILLLIIILVIVLPIVLRK